MSNKSLSEIHNEWVKELLIRGEKVLQPKSGNPHGSILGYIKTQIPHKDAGIIYKNEENGTFEILCDMCQYGVVLLELEDIGLCDAKCWYEWMEEDKHVPKNSKCYKPHLEHIKTNDLMDELLSREYVTSVTVPWGERFPDLNHDEWNIRTGPATVIIINTIERKDGYK